MQRLWRFLVPASAAAIYFGVSVHTDTPYIVAYAYSSGAGPPTKITVKSRGDPEADRSTITAAEAPPRRVPWLIVGGGIHGVHIAARLLGECVVKRGGVRIVDDGDTLLDRWKGRTSSTGMRHLRSSAGFHLDLREDSLRRFRLGGGERDQRQSFRSDNQGKKKKKKSRKANKLRQQQRMNSSSALFANDYARPELEFFNAHCDYVIEKYNLDEAHERGRAALIEPYEDHVRVTVSLPSSSPTVMNECNQKNAREQVVYLADNLVLALGNDEPSYPDWVTPQVLEVGSVWHLFDDRNVRNGRPCGEEKQQSVAIIGGGISAVHKALELAHRTRAGSNGTGAACEHEVHLICRHSIREQQFDTHQDWMLDKAAAARSRNAGGEGVPEKQRQFARVTSWEERRRIISRERVPGTVSAALHRGRGGLEYAMERGDVELHHGEVVACKPCCGGDDGSRFKSKRCDYELVLLSGETIRADEIILATGFGKRPPGGKLVAELVQKFGLEVSDFCGFPIVDRNLRWHPRIYASGALAELELGPSARNIAGARLAAERILEAAAGLKL